MSRRASGDDPARFLQELRQLRDGAGLGQAELAARAHYPYDRIKAAEVGPTLPDLPVLSAYVRGCGGTTEDWEERWRSLTSAPTLPLLDARPAGCSTAASAGARIGSITPVADTPDPSIIMAALDRVAEEMAVATPAVPPSRSGVSTIEQRSAFPVPPPAAAAKSASGKAGTGTVTAWETNTTRTAWSSATGPLAWEAGQPTPVGGPATAAEVRTPAAESAGTVAANAGPAEAAAATSGKTESAGSVGAGGADGSSGSAATRPVTGAAGAASTAVAGLAAVGRRSRALSRTTVAALIAIAICVLVALLAMLA
jgi:hypothetical protein